MRVIVLLAAAVSLLCVSQVFAQSPPECGKAGEVIPVSLDEQKRMVVGIPQACSENRRENWVTAPPKAGLSTQAICNMAMKPWNENTGRDMVGMKNMSACYCAENATFIYGIETKCWVFYDLD